MRKGNVTWLRIKAVAIRHAYILRRSPHRLYDITIWPLVDVLLFGSLGAFVARAEGGGETAFAYLLSGIILWHVIYQSQIAASTALLEETWSRNILNLMVTPTREREYAAGVALFGMLKITIGVVVVAITAFLFFAFNVTSMGLQIVPVMAVLLAIGWCIAIFVVGLVFRYGSGAEALAWGIMFAVMPLSGVFYPPDALPGLLQPVAQILPSTHAFIAARSLLPGSGGMDWGALGVAAVGTLVLAVVAMLFLVRMLGIFRSRGYITRYS